MKEFILTETRRVCRQIYDRDGYAECARLFSAIDIIEKLSNCARKEGILALEEHALELKRDGIEKHLIDMLMLVVDGTDPDIITEISIYRYFSECYDMYDALEYLMYLIGAMSIQAGENPKVTKEKLLALVPYEKNMEYNDRKKEEQ